jgi:hypothetical protein
VEILLPIFRYSRNLKFPFTSATIYRKVSSDYLDQIRKELVLDSFSMHNEELPHWHEDESFERDLDIYNQSTLPWKFSDEVKGVQEALLRQSWFTWDFMRRCQWKYMKENAIRGLRAFLADYSTGERGQEEREMVDRLFKCWELVPNHCLFQDRMSGSRETVQRAYQLTRSTDGAKFTACFDFSMFGQGSMLKVLIEFDCTKGGAHKHTGNYYVFPRLAPGCQIPSKLIRGPWTQERGNFLKLLIDSSDDLEMPWSSTADCEIDYNQARRGLKAAIIERCCPAIRALTSIRSSQEYDIDYENAFWENFGYHENNLFWRDSEMDFASRLEAARSAGVKFVQSKGEQRTESTDKAGVRRGPAKRMDKDRILVRAVDPKGPWLESSGKDWHEISWGGITPAMEHIWAALQVSIEDRDSELKLFKWITAVAKVKGGLDADEWERALRIKKAISDESNRGIFDRAIQWITMGRFAPSPIIW